MQLFGAFLNFDDIAELWLSAMRAAFIAGLVTLLAVGSLRTIFRHRISNAASHALYLLVPVKTVAAVLCVVCPLVVTFEMPERWISKRDDTTGEWVESPNKPPRSVQMVRIDTLEEPANDTANAGKVAMADSNFAESQHAPDSVRNHGEIDPKFKSNAERFWTMQFTTKHLMLAWASLCMLLTGICLARNVIVQYRLRRTSAPVSGDDVLLVADLAKTMGLSRALDLVATSSVATPAVIGLFRPRLIVPDGFFRSFDESLCRWAIAHELAHVRRADLWTLAFERLVSIAFFFCPALWISQRLSRHFRELACDDAAQDASGLSGGECAESFLKLIVWSRDRKSVV